ncbi:MAG: hypothetical protein ACRYG8_04925, partial [Janthinobacterium lividum]
EPEIAQAVVYGDGDSGLSAFIVAAEDTSPEAVGQAVGRVGARMTTTERVRRHRIVPPFTVENGLLTASHKIKRGLVVKTYRAMSPDA